MIEWPSLLVTGAIFWSLGQCPQDSSGFERGAGLILLSPTSCAILQHMWNRGKEKGGEGLGEGAK